MSETIRAVDAPHTLRETPLQERPQERLERLGARALSDAELLAMLLRSGSASVDVLTLARRMVASAQSLSGLLRYGAKDFERFPGVGKVKALQLVTVMEVARRVLAQGQAERPLLREGREIYTFMQAQTLGLPTEHAWVVCLDLKHRLLATEQLSEGGISAAIVDVRRLMRSVLQHQATTFCLVHNHPSGDPTPSSADIKLSTRIQEAAQLLDLRMLDHVIMGTQEADRQGQGYFSFHEAGLI